jgi:peptidoglycan/xylan/chitin deacetylase (PgdA/CDA1 family)
MVGEAVRRHGFLAREIVLRGHDAGGRGTRHAPRSRMGRDEERDFLREGFEALRDAVGSWPTGFYALRRRGRRGPIGFCRNSA